MDSITQQIPLLRGEADNYDGVTVTIAEHMDAEVFTERLRASLSYWREEVLTIDFRVNPYKLIVQIKESL